MNSFYLKIIAIITMLIDHIGAVLFPDMIWLRMIGRLAFPIFAYLISEGYFKTKDVKKYMLRLFIFALISQIPFYFAFREGFYLNVFFTLFLGLYAIYKYDQTKNYWVVFGVGMLAYFLNTDYNIYGIIMIFLFYKFHDNFKRMAVSQVWLNLLYLGIPILVMFLRGGKMTPSMIGYQLIQGLCLISLIFINYYNGEKGYSLKYVFYSFYPVHLGVLALISYLK
ncbi:TraX family protein [Acidilutibacter cellobiosedens]|nr:TraX family protein [Acidilutibacter cellobiosedens]